MYMSTVTFYLDKGYLLDYNDKEILFRKEKYFCYVRVLKSSGREGYRFENRFFTDRRTAEEETKKMYFSIRNQLIEKGIPIWYKNYDHGEFINPESYYPAIITEEGKRNPEVLFTKLKNKRIEAEVIGYNVYELITPIDDVVFIVQDIEFQKKCKLNVLNFEGHYYEDELLNTAYKILNLSNSVGDEKIAFILKITAFEVLVSPKQYKSEEVKKIIRLFNRGLLNKEKILKILKQNSIDISESNKEAIESIKSDLGEMNKLSILEKCKRLINEVYIDEIYFNEKEPVEFFNECYNIRSRFIHAGTYNIKDISNRSIELGNLITGILKHIRKKKTQKEE